MSALYTMRYQGEAGLNGGAVYMGHGVVAGVRANGGRFDGTYTQSGGRIFIRFSLIVPAGEALVTGEVTREETMFQLGADWPLDFADGRPQTVFLEGRPIEVVFEKVRDLP